jgi:hypothetical protein
MMATHGQNNLHKNKPSKVKKKGLETPQLLIKWTSLESKAKQTTSQDRPWELS